MVVNKRITIIHHPKSWDIWLNSHITKISTATKVTITQWNSNSRLKCANIIWRKVSVHCITTVSLPMVQKNLGSQMILYLLLLAKLLWEPFIQITKQKNANTGKSLVHANTVPAALSSMVTMKKENLLTLFLCYQKVLSYLHHQNK